MIRPFSNGPDDYYAAMDSPHWSNHVRPAVIERDGGKCRFCGCRNDLNVHHIRYQNDRGENDYFNQKWLITLCRKCHKIVTDAVDAAKQQKIEVPAFMVKPGIDAARQIENKIKHAAYGAEADLIADTLFKIWQRSLEDDCERVNMRNLDVLKPIGKVVMESIEYQAGMTAGGYGVAFAERTIRRITDYLAEAYIHYRSEGFSDADFRRFHKLNSSQMVNVRKNADRILRKCNHDGIGADACG